MFRARPYLEVYRQDMECLKSYWHQRWPKMSVEGQKRQILAGHGTAIAAVTLVRCVFEAVGRGARHGR